MRLVWYSRQAYYQHTREVISTTIEDEMIKQQVKHIRMNHRGIGTRKLYEMIQPFVLELRLRLEGMRCLTCSQRIICWCEKGDEGSRQPILIIVSESILVL